MHRMKQAALVVVTLSSVALVSGALAQPQQPQRRGRGAIGRIIAVNETGFDLAMGRGNNPQPVRVSVNHETRYFDLKRGAVADLKAEQRVVVFGQQAEGKVTARAIVRLGGLGSQPGERGMKGLLGLLRGLGGQQRGPRNQGSAPAPKVPHRPAVGKITSTSPLQVTTRDGQTLEVATTPQTAVLSLQPIALPDLKTGDFVRVMGERQGGVGQPVSVTATAVAKVPAPARGGRRGRRAGAGG
ncbi:MAG: hypothetical protein HY320_10735 [Armatimonadetes bacterium]|nr:hypothetical protein [Armatimonadota bacterium]